MPVGFKIGEDGKLTHDIVVRPSLTSGGNVNTTINKENVIITVSYGGKQMVNGNNTNRNIVKSKNKCPICNWFVNGLSSSLIIHMKNKHSSNEKKRSNKQQRRG